MAVGALLVLSLSLGRILRISLMVKLSASLLSLFAGAYTFLSASSSITAAKRNGWDLLPVLPVVFGTYQFSYAAGFTAGLLSR